VSLKELNPSGHTKALGLTQPLRHMKTRSISWGKRQPVCADYLEILGASTSWSPRSLPRPV